MIRSSFNSKFMGHHEFVFDMDVPLHHADELKGSHHFTDDDIQEENEEDENGS